MTDEELDLLEQFGGSDITPQELGSARIIEGDRVTDAFGNPRDKVNMADIGGVQRGGKRTRTRARTRARKQKTRRNRNRKRRGSRHTKQRKSIR